MDYRRENIVPASSPPPCTCVCMWVCARARTYMCANEGLVCASGTWLNNEVKGINQMFSLKKSEIVKLKSK